MASLHELSLVSKILFILIYTILLLPLIAFYAITWLLEPFQPEQFSDIDGILSHQRN